MAPSSRAASYSVRDAFKSCPATNTVPRANSKDSGSFVCAANA